MSFETYTLHQIPLLKVNIEEKYCVSVWWDLFSAGVSSSRFPNSWLFFYVFLCSFTLMAMPTWKMVAMDMVGIPTATGRGAWDTGLCLLSTGILSSGVTPFSTQRSSRKNTRTAMTAAAGTLSRQHSKTLLLTVWTVRIALRSIQISPLSLIFSLSYETLAVINNWPLGGIQSE